MRFPVETERATPNRVRREVRRASEDDAPAILELLERAFVDDPFVNWLARSRPRAIRSYLTLMLCGIALPKGVVHVAVVDSRIASAALWAPPHSFALTMGESLRMLPRMVAMIGPLRFTRVAALLEEVERARGPEPRWLLTLLGTTPEMRGLGLASAVMAPVLARCDAKKQPAVCETSAPANLPFYRKQGFEIGAERPLGEDGPRCWTLRRGPK